MNFTELLCMRGRVMADIRKQMRMAPPYHQARLVIHELP